MTINNLADVELVKGMSDSEINNLISEYTLLDDNIYLGSKHKHNWVCMCGGIIHSTWSNLRKRKKIVCRNCRYPNLQKHKSSTLNELDKCDISKLKHKNIDGFEDYIVYEDGSIYSNKSNKFLRFTANSKNGYLYVSLRDKCGKIKNKLVHRIVAENLIENTNKLEYNIVNHIDSNKENNHIHNLEWCNQEYNIRHCINMGRDVRNTNTVIGYDDSNNVLIRCEGIRKLERDYGYSRTMVSKAIKSKEKYRDLYWEYIK